MTAIVTRVATVQLYGDTLSIVRLENGATCIANRKEDGSLRWGVGDLAVFVNENSVLTEDVMKERGYWNEEADRGYLGGNKRNRVRPRAMGPDSVVTEGLMFQVEPASVDDDNKPLTGVVTRGDQKITVNVGDDVSEFLEITGG